MNPLSVLFISCALLLLLSANASANNGQLLGRTIRFESTNFPRHFVNVRPDGRVWIDKLKDGEDFRSVVYTVVSGLAGSGVSFKSSTGSYLRHRNFLLHSDKNDGTDLFRKDATWFPVKGRSNLAGYSFRSFNFPAYFLRHQNFRLKISKGSGPPFPQDATWFMQLHPGNLPV